MKTLNLLAKFAKFFINNYQVSVLVIFFLLIGGFSGYMQLPRQGMPDVEIPYSVITAVYPGATPEQVEKDVTEKIESSLEEVDGIKEIESSSQKSVSSVVLTLESGMDLEKILDDVRRQVAGINDLPEDVESPNVIELDAAGPDLLINIVGDASKEELAKYAEKYKNKINSVSGVEKVELWNDVEEVINIDLDLEKLNKNGLTYDQVKQIILATSLNIPGGTLETNDDNLPIQIDSRLTSIEEIKNIQVGIVKLDDIASVEKQSILDGDAYVTGYVKDGNMKVSETVTVAVYVKSTEDVIRITDNIHNQIDELEDDVPETINVVTVYEVAKDVKIMLGSLFTNAWQGLIVILIVLFIFISFRSSLVSAFIIPLVLLTTFFIFSITNLNLNFITLYALILSLGIVIDNAIVIVEGVQHNIKQGMNRIEAAINAVQDLGPALIAATATTVLVFIPMIFLGGISGEFIKYIPFTILITLATSIVIAFSITPFLSRMILSEAKKQKRAAWATDKCIAAFCTLVKFILKSKYRIIASLVMVAILMAGSGLLAGKIKVDIWPEVDDAEFFQITLKYPKNSSQNFKQAKIKEMTDKITQLYSDNSIVKENIENFAPFSFAHGGGIQDQSMFLVNLVDADDMTVKNSEVISVIQNELDEINNIEAKAENFAQGPPSAEYPVEVQIANEDLDILEKAALDLGNYLEDEDGVKKIDNGVTGEKTPQISITLDREKMAKAGIMPIQVAGVVRSMYNPEKVIEIHDADEAKTSEVKLGFDQEHDLEDLRNLQIVSKKLYEIASVEQVELLKSINHFDKKRFIEIKVGLEEGVEAADINEKIENYFSDSKLSELNLQNNAITYRGDMESEEQTFDDFAMMMLVSMIAIYALLTFQFRSFAQPFIIMLAIPLAIIGVFPGLLIVGSPISFMALLGIVVLMGIVVNNSIILIDRFNKLRKQENLDLVGAIVEGVSQRTRPIFATTLTTIAGILPLTITESYWLGMGTTIISGLIASALFVLIIIPVVYYLYIALLVKIKQKLAGKKK